MKKRIITNLKDPSVLEKVDILDYKNSEITPFGYDVGEKNMFFFDLPMTDDITIVIDPKRDLKSPLFLLLLGGGGLAFPTYVCLHTDDNVILRSIRIETEDSYLFPLLIASLKMLLQCKIARVKFDLSEVDKLYEEFRTRYNSALVDEVTENSPWETQ